MSNATFTITINAPKQHVWDVMLGDATYRQWTTPFHEGSYFAGSWSKGATMRFLAMDDGKLGGMVARIAENIPGELLSIEYLGEVAEGKDDTTSERARQWQGSHETYHFSEQDGVTTLVVELSGDTIDPAMLEMFKGMWPQALAKLKILAE